MNLESTYLNLFKKKCKKGEYFLVSYRPVSKKESYVSVSTSWIGHKDKFEIRAADWVDVGPTFRLFKLLQYPLGVVNIEQELTAFLKIGGHAIIHEELIDHYWEDIKTPRVVTDTYGRGYLDYQTVDAQGKQRFAKGNFRMVIMERDNFQCRICGSSPDDNRHVRIEVHHIKPWEEGGLTTEDNLITLCKLCHDGVSQISREALYRKIGHYFPFRDHELYPRGHFSTADQLYRHLYLSSNTVTFKINSTSLLAKNEN